MPTLNNRDRVPRKQLVVGVGISATSYDEVVGCCRGWIDDRRAGRNEATARFICVTSVHGVITAHRDSAISEILNASDIATPDGMPLVWALRSLGVKEQTRVYGPTLMLRLCEDAERHGHRVFLYGGLEETLPRLQSRLTSFFPGLQIVGSYSPPFRPLTREEDRLVRQRIVDSNAEIVFVGISTPKQERWMYSHREAFPGIVMIGVGAAFDFHAGRVRQAPGWMQRNGLEWLFRLTMEPRRLWHRYLVETPRFLPLWGLQLLRNRMGGEARRA